MLMLPWAWILMVCTILALCINVAGHLMDMIFGYMAGHCFDLIVNLHLHL